MIKQDDVIFYIKKTRNLIINILIEYYVIDETSTEIKIHLKYLNEDNELCFYNYTYLKSDIIQYIRSQKLIEIQHGKINN